MTGDRTEKTVAMTAALDDAPAIAPTARDPRFGSVFRRYARFVMRSLRNLGVAPADVEDVCQEVFMVVHGRLADLDGDDRLRTWIYRVARNTAANYRRAKRRRGGPRMPLQTEPSVEPAQERAVVRKRASQRLALLLDELDDGPREIFVLYEIEQLSMREACEVVGCPLQTGYSRLKAARRKMMQAAARAGWNGEGDV